MKSKAFGFWAAAAFAVQTGACSGQLDIGRVGNDGGAASPDGGSEGTGADGGGSSSGSGGGSSGVFSSGSSGGSSGGSSSGSGSGTSSGASSGSPGSSSGSGPTDASFEFDAPRAQAGLAGFAFVVNGVVQTPLTCSAEGWEYPPPVGSTGQPIVGASDSGLGSGLDTICNGGTPPCPGLTVLLVNTGQFPVAYTAQALWGGWEPPGVPFGNMNEVSGVMDPGESVDISSAYTGGIVAVLGSSQPFVDPDAGKYVADGTTVAWPAGVAGSDGATQMFVAEIEVVDACRNPAVYWP